MNIIKNDKDEIVWKIDKLKKVYEYCFNSTTKQKEIIKTLIFEGYSKKPIGLNKNGCGYSRFMTPFKNFLKEAFDSVEELRIKENIKTKANTKNGKIYIQINKDDYEKIVNDCKEIQTDNTKRLNDCCYANMQLLFPKKFPKKQISTYSKNTISKILQQENILDYLSQDDIKQIALLVPELMEKSTIIKNKVMNNLLFNNLTKKSTRIKLFSIIETYEDLLKKKTQKENDWQQFLKQNMLFFNSSYINLIEKQNISIQCSLPDFLLIDQFEFVDVFEIKRPDFPCIKYDKSHDNYYWSEEASKAIAQTEKYINELEQNSNNIIVSLKNEGLDLNIIKPRGFVLISKRELLTDTKMQNSFRLLQNSLKNVQVILYDDFLNSIKTKYNILEK